MDTCAERRAGGRLLLGRINSAQEEELFAGVGGQGGYGALQPFIFYREVA